MDASWSDLGNGAAELRLDQHGYPDDPLVVIDLDAHGGPTDDLLPPAGARAIVVGVTAGTPHPHSVPHLTCVITPDEVADVTATVAANPIASLTLVNLINNGFGGPHAALVAESLAYSTLLAGAEFRAWLDRTTAAPPASTDDPVLVELSGNTLTITLNRPDRHNAYSAAVRDGLRDALAVALADPRLEVVLRGAGPSFCSGGDLGEFGSSKDPSIAHLVRLATTNAVSLLLLSARTTAAIHGACIGAGIELAAFAGRVEAADDAWFQLPELSMGLIPGAGGTVSLTARIGPQRTAQLALTGRPIDVATALDWGLIDARCD